MGHEIVYCANCQIRLSGLDFEKEKAFRIGLPVRAGLRSTRQVFAGGEMSTSVYGRYAGLLSDVRIWKTPLADAEIRKLRGLPELRR